MLDVNTFLLLIKLLPVSMRKYRHHQGVYLYTKVTKSVEVH